MRRKSLLIVQAMFILLGTLTVQACFYSRPDYYGPPAGTVVLGDYDEGHVWHDRYWWIANRHAWVHQYHPDWLEHETPAQHAAFMHP